MSESPKPAPGDQRVFISNRESRCDECQADLGSRAMIFLAGDRGAFCLSCADLDHLVFLRSGDAALTRRARKHSRLAAVVLKWSRARKCYERQGLLVEEEAARGAQREITRRPGRGRRAGRVRIKVRARDPAHRYAADRHHRRAAGRFTFPRLAMLVR